MMRISAFLIALVLAFSACQPTNTPTPTVFADPSDPFVESMPELQGFQLQAGKDTVIQGQSGIKVVIPAGSITQANGEAPKGIITFELAEALSTADQVLANLTTTSGGELLETGGMLYINATSEGEQLIINPDIPVLIDVPTQERKAGMNAYKGVRDADGNMDWIDPIPIREYLTTVPFEDLDFLPDSFAIHVAQVLPFRGHTVATKSLVDSLYFSFAVGAAHVDLTNLDLNEAYLQGHEEVVNGAYTEDSFEGDTQTTREGWMNKETWVGRCGISPAWIKAIQAPELQETFFATKAFERRLKAIHHSQSLVVFHIYTENLHKTLAFCDARVVEFLQAELIEAQRVAVQSDSLGSCHWCSRKREEEVIRLFQQFAEEKLTNVERPSDQLRLLSAFVSDQKRQVDADLNRLKALANEALAKDQEKAEVLASEYREVLWKREEHRMESYGFEWSNTGWINVDKGAVPKTEWNSGTPRHITVTVEGGDSYDRVHSYLVTDYVKSIYRLNTKDGVAHKVGDGSKGLLMMAYEQATCITIGYKGNQMYFNLQHFVPKKEPNLAVQLRPASKEDVHYTLTRYEQGTSENSIQMDLQFQEQIYQEELRQANYLNEQKFFQDLAKRVYPCCLCWFGDTTDDSR